MSRFRKETEYIGGVLFGLMMVIVIVKFIVGCAPQPKPQPCDIIYEDTHEIIIDCHDGSLQHFWKKEKN